MRPYKCDVCGEPATIHETAIECGGAIVSRHHCQEHGMDALDVMGVDDPGSHAAFATIVKRYNHLKDSEKAQLQMEYRLSRRCC